MQLHKELTEEEEYEFRLWARDNFRDYNSPHPNINPTWHPVVKHECERMRAEYKLGLKLRAQGASQSEAEHAVQKLRDTYEA